MIVKNPVTAYAIAKCNAEQKLHMMASDNFVVTSLRPSTVFGTSPRLRCDIVFNNLLACGYTTGKIEIMSDGNPLWHHVVFVKYSPMTWKSPSTTAGLITCAT